MSERILNFSQELTDRDKKRGIRLVATGMKHIRSELLDDWIDNALANITDPRGLAAYSASLRLMQALSKGRPPEVAYQQVNLDNFSGRAASMIEVTAIHFHPRGLELKEYLDPDHTRFSSNLGNPNRTEST